MMPQEKLVMQEELARRGEKKPAEAGLVGKASDRLVERRADGNDRPEPEGY